MHLTTFGVMSIRDCQPAVRGLARVMGPQKVAGTLHSETPLELGAGKGTIREISMRGSKDCLVASEDCETVAGGGC